MSLIVSGKVWHIGFSPASKFLVAVHLADVSNDHGVSWWSNGAIASRCKIAKDTVKAIMSELEKEQWIVRSPRYARNGSQLSSLVRWNLEKLNRESSLRDRALVNEAADALEMEESDPDGEGDQAGGVGLPRGGGGITHRAGDGWIAGGEGRNTPPLSNVRETSVKKDLSPRQAAGGAGVVSDLFGVPQSLPGESEAEPDPVPRPEASSPAVANPGATATRPARKRDEGWDALAEIEGAKGGEVNKLAASGIGKALKAIREVCPLVNGELAGEIRRRAAVYRATWPNATLSAMALAKHWARMDSAQSVAPRAARDVGVGAAGFAAKFAERVGGGR